MESHKCLCRQIVRLCSEFKKISKKCNELRLEKQEQIRYLIEIKRKLEDLLIKLQHVQNSSRGTKEPGMQVSRALKNEEGESFLKSFNKEMFQKKLDIARMSEAFGSLLSPKHKEKYEKLESAFFDLIVSYGKQVDLMASGQFSATQHFSSSTEDESFLETEERDKASDHSKDKPNINGSDLEQQVGSNSETKSPEILFYTPIDMQAYIQSYCQMLCMKTFRQHILASYFGLLF
jgi:hypothetical protein